MENAIKGFFDERKATWLKTRLKGSMTEEEKLEKEKECEEKFDLENWLPDAAKRANQLTMASHPCKFSHPSAKTSAVIAIAEKRADGFLRTGNTDAGPDVFGNAAALDVQKFLSLKGEDGVELLTHIENKSVFAKKLFKINSVPFDELQAGFLSIKKTGETPVTSGRIKQVYFPVDNGYHLLSILTPSGLMYELRNRINDIRFSGQAKEARDLKKKGKHSETGFNDLMNLTMIGYGGTKPQNISVLNNQYGGKAYLLPSIPPFLENRKIRLPKTDFFRDCLWLNRFAELFQKLRKLLQIGYNNANIRDGRDRLINAIVDQIIDQVWVVRYQESGWSQRQAYLKLPKAQKIWLDNFYETERETSDTWLENVMFEMARWITLSYNKKVKSKDRELKGDELMHILSLIIPHKEALK